jgi:hypothetical protein
LVGLPVDNAIFQQGFLKTAAQNFVVPVDDMQKAQREEQVG